MNKLLFLSFLLLIICSCNQEQDQIRPGVFAPKVVKGIGYLVPGSSVIKPIMVIVKNPKVVPVGKPVVIPTNTNIHYAAIPKVVLAGTPRIATPGQGGFSMPKKIPASAIPIAAGLPEVIIAQDAASKDQNPKNLSSFGKLQGLKHGLINCLLEDKSGNLWFGTDGGELQNRRRFLLFPPKEKE